jgi:transcriptional regulator with XRE-family HTH domain
VIVSKFNPQKLKSLRRAAGLSRRDLARACVVSRITVAEWEQGKYSPRVARLEALANALDCTISDFFEQVPDGQA